MKINILTFYQDDTDFRKFKKNFLELNPDNEFNFVESTVNTLPERITAINNTCGDKTAKFTMLVNNTSICNRNLAEVFNKLATFDFDLAGSVDLRNTQTKKMFKDYLTTYGDYFIDLHCCIISNDNFIPLETIDENDIEDIDQESALGMYLNIYLNKHVILPYLYCSAVNCNVVDFENCYLGDLENIEKNDFLSPAMYFLDKYDPELATFKYKIMPREDLLDYAHKNFVANFLHDEGIKLKYVTSNPA